MFDGKLSLTRDICEDELIQQQLKVPVKSKPAKPVAKRAGKWDAQSASASSSNSQPVLEMPNEHVQEFEVTWAREKKFHTVPAKRADDSNIMFQWD